MNDDVGPLGGVLSLIVIKAQMGPLWGTGRSQAKTTTGTRRGSAIGEPLWFFYKTHRPGLLFSSLLE
jgi:hypothetical protein